MKLTLLQNAYTNESQLPSQVKRAAVSPKTLHSPLPDKSQEKNLPPYVKSLSQCKLLICRVHSICLTLKDLTKHLTQEHGMSEEKASQVFRAACELTVVGTRSGIKIPPPEAPPIQGLDVLLGYRCTCRIGCGVLSPRRESLQIHLSKHGIHRKRPHGALYKEVSMQNFFTGRRPLYFVVNTSATREKVEEGSTAGKTGCWTEDRSRGKWSSRCNSHPNWW